MAYNDPRTIVSTGWLADRLRDPDLRVLDGSWHLPQAGRNGRAEFEKVHIPGARFFDIDEYADHSTGLPHMIPREEDFEGWMGGFGIGNDSQVVVYDGTGLFSAARVWWLLRHMGMDRVAVLDGGLPKWKSEGRELESDVAAAAPAAFKARRRPEMARSKDDVKRACATGDAQVLDARPADRFRGEAPEPRPGLRAGHMPGAVNVPFSSLLNPDKTMKPPEELKAAFDKAGADFDRSFITSCGSGVTASMITLALEILGHGSHGLYDGSWAEWGQEGDTEVVTG